MNSIKDHENLNKKKVLLRLDLNAPLKNGIITDQTSWCNWVMDRIKGVTLPNEKTYGGKNFQLRFFWYTPEIGIVLDLIFWDS